MTIQTRTIRLRLFDHERDELINDFRLGLIDPQTYERLAADLSDRYCQLVDNDKEVEK